MSIDSLVGIKTLMPTNIGLKGIDEQPESTPTVSFGEYLQSALGQVSELEETANQLKNDFAMGKTDNISDVLIASEKATIALQFTMQIRNKLLDAYTEIMRMQI